MDMDGVLVAGGWLHSGEVDREGNVWVVERLNHRILKFNPTLDRALMQLATTGEPGTDETHLNSPSGASSSPAQATSSSSVSSISSSTSRTMFIAVSAVGAPQSIACWRTIAWRSFAENPPSTTAARMCSRCWSHCFRALWVPSTNTRRVRWSRPGRVQISPHA